MRVERARLARLLGRELAPQREPGEARRLFMEIDAAASAERPVKELAA